MHRIATTLSAFCFLICIYSCKKNDASLEQLSQTEPDSRAKLKKCQIAEIAYSNKKMVFEYNQHGDPLSVKRLPSTGTGEPSYFFKYDQKRRLTEIYGMYGNTMEGTNLFGEV